MQTAGVVMIGAQLDAGSSLVQLVEHQLLKECESENIVAETEDDVVGSHRNTEMQLVVTNEELQVLGARIV
jgi:hypothetical protein